MQTIEKTDRGILIPNELLTECEIDPDTLEVETTRGQVILKQGRRAKQAREALMERMDQRSEAIYQRVGLVGESSHLIREDREAAHH